MKKTFFLLFLGTVITGNIMAQDAVPTQAPASKDQIERETKAKKEEAAKAKRTTQEKKVTSSTDYGKSGLTAAQIASISNEMKDLDAKKYDIEQDTKLSKTQKNDALLAIEVERKAIMKKAKTAKPVPATKAD